MKKYLVDLNGSFYNINLPIANALINSAFNFHSYIKDENLVFILDDNNISFLKGISTTSLSHFYVSISDKKYRINKQLYLSLKVFITQFIKSKFNPKTVVKPIAQHIRLVDLFSGTGSALCASKKLPIQNCFSIDSCPNSKRIFEANFSLDFNNNSISNIEASVVPNHDILIAGFPCQPYSIAGKRKGLHDSRSNVFNDVIRIAKTKNPRFIVLENVKYLKLIDKGKTLQYLLNLLEGLGYYTEVKIINTLKVTDIPQNRERIFIFCFAKKSDLDNFNFDFKTVKNRHISEFLVPNVSSKYYIKKTSVLFETFTREITEHVETGYVYQYRRSKFRKYINQVPTLTANMGTGGHNVPLIKDNFGIRKLTPRECFRLQGFSDDYILVGSDSALYKLIGNAISVKVLELILEKFCSTFYN